MLLCIGLHTLRSAASACRCSIRRAKCSGTPSGRSSPAVLARERVRGSGGRFAHGECDREAGEFYFLVSFWLRLSGRRSPTRCAIRVHAVCRRSGVWFGGGGRNQTKDRWLIYVCVCVCIYIYVYKNIDR